MTVTDSELKIADFQTSHSQCGDLLGEVETFMRDIGFTSGLGDHAMQLENATRRLSAESERVRGEEATARQEAVVLQRECTEGLAALRKQQVERTDAVRTVGDLEMSLTAVRHRASVAEATNDERKAELEARCSTLCSELEAQGAAHARSLAKNVNFEARWSELNAHIGRLTQELEATEAMGTELEAALSGVVRSGDTIAQELRAEGDAAYALAAEAAVSVHRQESLRGELADERRCAQDASRMAAELLEQRRRVSEEADKALRRCDSTLTSWQEHSIGGYVLGHRLE